MVPRSLPFVVFMGGFPSRLQNLSSGAIRPEGLLFSYLGGPGEPLRQTQVNDNFRAVRPYHRADICITREKHNHQFFIYGPQYKKCESLAIWGGPVWSINNRTGPILLPSYPLTYINLHVKYGSNPIRIC